LRLIKKISIIDVILSLLNRRINKNKLSPFKKLNFMKTTIVALIMCMAVSMQLLAGNDIVVNHHNKTVTLVANFISPAPIEKSLTKAAELWNSRSGKNTCEMLVNGKKEKYAIHFKLVVNQNPLSDTAVNVVTVIPDSHPFFYAKTTMDANGNEQTDRAVSVSDGKVIGVSSLYKNNKYVLAHEMGHNIGLCHNAGRKCCYVSEEDLAIFNLSKSVSDLADASIKSKTTRKMIELGTANGSYVASN
jgi:hypothetical protein